MKCCMRRIGIDHKRGFSNRSKYNQPAFAYSDRTNYLSEFKKCNF